MHLILDPATESSELVGSLYGSDLTGKTVLEVEGSLAALGQSIDWTTLTLVDDVEGARAAKWEEVKAAREAAEWGGCTTALGPIDTDPESQRRILGVVLLAQIAKAAGVPFLQPWTMADNQVVDHGADQAIAMGIAVGNHVAACHAVGRDLRAALAAAATRGDIDAIEIATAPWP
jgi:hypothetical protein